MTRYIDVDELLKGRQDHEMISTHLIWNAPTVDVVERKKRKWIRIKIDDAYYLWRCSNCDMKTAFYCNFCPNCGADMRERSEDAEIH